MTTNVNYGSLEDPTDKGSFDEKNTYYLKETTLTREQRMRKLVLIATPIICAVILVGGAAFLLFRKFDFLYPGRHGSGGGGKEPSFNPPTRIEHNSVEDQPDSSPHSAPSILEDEKKRKSDVASSCTAHAKCAKLGILGECCPTTDGTFLQCCN